MDELKPPPALPVALKGCLHHSTIDSDPNCVACRRINGMREIGDIKAILAQVEKVLDKMEKDLKKGRFI